MPLDLHNRGEVYPFKVYASVGGNSTRGASFLLSLRRVDRPNQQKACFVPPHSSFSLSLPTAFKELHGDITISAFVFSPPSSKGSSLV